MSGFAHTSSQSTLGGKSWQAPTREERDRDRQVRASFEHSARGVKTQHRHSSPLKDNYNPHRRSLDQRHGYLDYELGARLCGLHPPQQPTSKPSPPRHRDPSRHDVPRHQQPSSQAYNMIPPRVTNMSPTRQPLPSPGVENVALRKHHKLPSQESDSRGRREKAHLTKRHHEIQFEANHYPRRASHEISSQPSVEKLDFGFDLAPEPEYYGGGVGTLLSVIPPLPPQEPLMIPHGAAYQLAHEFQTTPAFTSYDTPTLPGAYPITSRHGQAAPAYHAAGVESTLMDGVERIMQDGEPVDRGEFDGFHCTDRQYAEDGRHVVSNLGLVEGFSMVFKDEVEMIDDALEAMIANAKRQGANGVLGIQVDLADDGAVIARGQAVVLV